MFIILFISFKPPFDNITFIFKTFLKFIEYLLVKLLSHAKLSIVRLNKNRITNQPGILAAFKKCRRGSHISANTLWILLVNMSYCGHRVLGTLEKYSGIIYSISEKKIRIRGQSGNPFFLQARKFP